MQHCSSRLHVKEKTGPLFGLPNLPNSIFFLCRNLNKMAAFVSESQKVRNKVVLKQEKSQKACEGGSFALKEHTWEKRTCNVW